MKITFLGAGSTIFAKNVLGDVMCSKKIGDAEINLYDIEGKRLDESMKMLEAINNNSNKGRAHIKGFLGIENRRQALEKADFIVNAVQIGGYDATIVDFEIPKKYGLRQTIGDTLGIGGIMRGLRTIPVMEEFARDVEAVCPSAWFINYTNPMAILTGYMQRYTGVKTVGLCHSVQECTNTLLPYLDMSDKLEGRKELIAGINHMAWLLEIRDKNGNDLYPEIRHKAAEKNIAGPHKDMVRFEYIRHLGYYCTESSEHNAEYNPFFIKAAYPELIEKLNIPLDEYPRRYTKRVQEWEQESRELVNNPTLIHERTQEYASYIIESIAADGLYQFGGNVINSGLIDNLPDDACVEVPCVSTGQGIWPCKVGKLPVQLAAMNVSNINVQLLTIAAAVEKKKDLVYNAAMMDPHTAAELDIDSIVALCDELLEAHSCWLPSYSRSY